MEHNVTLKKKENLPKLTLIHTVVMAWSAVSVSRGGERRRGAATTLAWPGRRPWVIYVYTRVPLNREINLY